MLKYLLPVVTIPLFFLSAQEPEVEGAATTPRRFFRHHGTSCYQPYIDYGCYGHGYSSGYSHGYSGYSHGFTASYGDYPYEQKVVAQEVAVAPLIVTVPVDIQAVDVRAYGVPYYFSVGDAYNQKAMMRELVVMTVQEMLRTGTGSAAAATLPSNIYNAIPNLSGQGQTSGPVAGQVGNGGGVRSRLRKPKQDATTPAELRKAVLDVFTGKPNCVNCHGPSKNSERLGLVVKANDAYDLADLSEAERWQVYGMCVSRVMPKGADTDPAKAVDSQQMVALLRYALQK